MDMLTLAKAKQYAQALVETLNEDVSGLENDVLEMAGNLNDLLSDAQIIDSDGDLASTILLNAIRQLRWNVEEGAPVCEEGSVTLTNTSKFPFNDSAKSVALATAQKNTKYAVIAAIASANGNAGEVVVSDKQTNGFKLAYTGSASSAVVKYIVIGGIIE